MRQEAATVRITEKISADLALRNVADDFFDLIESLPSNNLTVDFVGVRSISRSFAHQYTARKKITSKLINEINMPDNVVKMLEIVRNSSYKSKYLNLDSIRPMTM